MNKNDCCYVIGHAGLVGSNLLNRLKKEGYKNLIFFAHDEIDLIRQNAVEKIFRDYMPDYVFLTAAVVGGIQANINNPYKFLYDNLMIQNNVINACIKYKVKKVMCLASVCMLPKDYRQPLKEEYILQAPLENTNENYALSKICLTKLCSSANKQFDTKFIVLSPCNLFGIGDNFDPENSHVLQALIRKIYEAKQDSNDTVEIWGMGNPRREFMFSADIVDCMMWAMNNIEKTDTFLNVGTGIDHSIKELAEMVAEIIGWNGKFTFNTEKPDGMKKKLLCIDKIKDLGWKAKTPLKDGIKKTIEYYKDNIA